MRLSLALPLVLPLLASATALADDGGPASAPASQPASAPANQPARAPAMKPGKSVMKGSLSREEIQRVVRAGFNDLKACYERSDALDEGRSGKVVLNFIIAGDGTVGSAESIADTLGDAETTACLVGLARGWRFPKPKGGGQVFVTYPFVFSPNSPPKKAASSPPKKPPSKATSDSSPPKQQRTVLRARPLSFFEWFPHVLCR